MGTIKSPPEVLEKPQKEANLSNGCQGKLSEKQLFLKILALYPNYHS